MSKTLGIAAACLALATAGLVAGLLVERLLPPRPLPGAGEPFAALGPAGHVQEQSATLVNIRDFGRFEIFYAQPFESPPALDLFDDNPQRFWNFKVLEQRSDGFRLEVTRGGLVLNAAGDPKQLRYVARGRPLTAEPLVVQWGALDPSDHINFLSFAVYYPRPYAHAPALKLTEPGPVGWETRIAEQWPHGFRVRLTSYFKTEQKPARYEARGVLRKAEAPAVRD